MTPVSASPIACPNWATVLNTAPARAWVETGNAEVVTMIPTVKRTARFQLDAIVRALCHWDILLALMGKDWRQRMGVAEAFLRVNSRSRLGNGGAIGMERNRL
jgi:hypothetical protein